MPAPMRTGQTFSVAVAACTVAGICLACGGRSPGQRAEPVLSVRAAVTAECEEDGARSPGELESLKTSAGWSLAYPPDATPFPKARIACGPRGDVAAVDAYGRIVVWSRSGIVTILQRDRSLNVTAIAAVPLVGPLPPTLDRGAFIVSNWHDIEAVIVADDGGTGARLERLGVPVEAQPLTFALGGALLRDAQYRLIVGSVTVREDEDARFELLTRVLEGTRFPGMTRYGGVGVPRAAGTTTAAAILTGVRAWLVSPDARVVEVARTGTGFLADGAVLDDRWIVLADDDGRLSLVACDDETCAEIPTADDGPNGLPGEGVVAVERVGGPNGDAVVVASRDGGFWTARVDEIARGAWSEGPALLRNRETLSRDAFCCGDDACAWVDSRGRFMRWWIADDRLDCLGNQRPGDEVFVRGEGMAMAADGVYLWGQAQGLPEDRPAVCHSGMSREWSCSPLGFAGRPAPQYDVVFALAPGPDSVAVVGLGGLGFLEGSIGGRAEPVVRWVDEIPVGCTDEVGWLGGSLVAAGSYPRAAYGGARTAVALRPPQGGWKILDTGPWRVWGSHRIIACAEDRCIVLGLCDRDVCPGADGETTRYGHQLLEGRAGTGEEDSWSPVTPFPGPRSLGYAREGRFAALGECCNFWLEGEAGWQECEVPGIAVEACRAPDDLPPHLRCPVPSVRGLAVCGEQVLVDLGDGDLWLGPASCAAEGWQQVELGLGPRQIAGDDDGLWLLQEGLLWWRPCP